MEFFHEITEVINAFRHLTGIGICFYHLNSFFTYDRLGVRNNRGHHCKFCTSIRLLPDGPDSCNGSDRGEAVSLAKIYRKPFFFKCHAGLCELVLPLIYEDNLTGVVFLGQCRIKGEDNSKAVANRALELGGEANYFVQTYQSLPEVNRESLKDMGNILERYFKILFQIRGDGAMQRFIADNSSEPLCQQICDYISRKYMQDITPGKICDMLFLNSAYVARVFRRDTGMTMTAFINRTRIDNAKKLLAGTTVPVSSIALNVGFSDANYFTRIFKKLEGVTPAEYRKSLGQSK